MFKPFCCSLVLTTAALAATPLESPEFLNALPMQDGPYKPNWESMAAQFKPADWIRDAKFGIFLHWGIGAVPARHGWYGRAMYDPETSPEVVQWHGAHYGHQSVFGYKDLIPLWKAEKWDPDALVRQFKKAGARYIMPVAVDQDNFDNYNSNYQPWNSVNMGPHRDIVGDWRKAALKEGLHFTVASHQHAAWDWFGRAYNYDTSGPKAGVPWDAWQTRVDGMGKWWEGYNPADLYVPHFLRWSGLDVRHHTMVRTNRGDWPFERDILDADGTVRGTVKVDPAAPARFIQNWYLRTKDLIDQYHPEMLYIDGGLPFGNLPCKDTPWLRLNAHYYNSSLQWNGWRLAVATNLQHIKAWPPAMASGTHEQIRRSTVEDYAGGMAGDRPWPLPWQHSDAVNNEWFDDSNSPQHATKRPDDIVRMLVDTVSRNGNLLLNISLRADGTVVPEDQAVLDALAAFMANNSEALHETRPWLLAQDRAGDAYFTTKGDVLYAILLRWADGGTVTLPALTEGRCPWVAGVQRVSVLGQNWNVTFRRTPEGLVVKLPKDRPGDFHGMALKLEGRGTPVVAGKDLPAAPSAPPEPDQVESALRIGH